MCIVGAGLAGARAATTLRQRGFDGEIVMVGEEQAPPYDRPPLSKTYLTGKTPQAKLGLAPPGGWGNLEIEWRGSSRVVAIDRSRRRLILQDGEQLPYSKLALATGSTPARPQIRGHELTGVMTFSTLEDSDRLRGWLVRRPRVLVVGGGFLGCELAGAAIKAGCAVTLVEKGPSLLPGLDGWAGEVAHRLHESHGCKVVLGVSVIAFGGTAKVEVAMLDDGARHPCDLVLLCVGSRPRTELAARAGLKLGSGVLVDGRCRTSDPLVFAAGDVACFWDPSLRRRVRLEHWDNAHRQGTHLAEAILGGRRGYHPVPYFWSEQYDAMIQQVGWTRPSDERVVVGRPESGHFTVLHLSGARVRACLAVNRYPDLAAARRLIEAGAPVDRSALLAPEADLRTVARDAIAAVSRP